MLHRGLTESELDTDQAVVAFLGDVGGAGGVGVTEGGGMLADTEVTGHEISYGCSKSCFEEVRI